MEDNKGNKRSREEFEDCELEANSVPNLKLPRVDSANTATHVEPDPDDGGSQSPEAKRIEDDLLNILDDSDPVINGPDPEIQGLDLVIKSFEEEILVPAPQTPESVMKSYSGESRSELGFLLEASEDVLDLPPNFSFSEEEQKFETVDQEECGGPGGDVGFAEMMGYDEFPISSYESFEFGVDGVQEINNNGDSKSGEFVALGGLFDTTVDISELTWRPESLSAL